MRQVLFLPAPYVAGTLTTSVCRRNYGADHYTPQDIITEPNGEDVQVGAYCGPGWSSRGRRRLGVPLVDRF